MSKRKKITGYQLFKRDNRASEPLELIGIYQTEKEVKEAINLKRVELDLPDVKWKEWADLDNNIWVEIGHPYIAFVYSALKKPQEQEPEELPVVTEEPVVENVAVEEADNDVWEK